MCLFNIIIFSFLFLSTLAEGYKDKIYPAGKQYSYVANYGPFWKVRPVSVPAVVKYIQQSDFTPYFLICFPGHYVFSQSIVFQPESTGQCAIIIASSDVNLNLSGMRLNYTGSLSETTGISICKGAQNVTIENGFVYGFTENGIELDLTTTRTECSTCVRKMKTLIDLQKKAKARKLEEKTVFDSGSEEVDLNAAEEEYFACGYRGTVDTITNVLIKDISSCNNKNGLYFNGGASSNIYALNVVNCLAESNSERGLKLEKILSSTIENSSSVRTKNSTAVVGIECVSCKAIKMKNINCESHASTLATASGISLQNCDSCELENCDVLNIEGSNSYGFYFSQNRTSSLKNCNSSFINALDGNAYGYNLNTEKNFSAINSASQSVISSTGSTFGWKFDTCHYPTLKDCTTKDCDSSESAVDAYGFVLEAGEGAEFNNCLATEVIGGTSTDSIGAGFSLDKNQKRSFFVKCKSLANSGGSGEAYGFKFGSANYNVTGNILKECYIANNFGDTKQYGFKDFAEESTTLLLHNTSAGQGRVFSDTGEFVDTGTMNYCLTFATRPVDLSELILETTYENLQTISTSVVGYTNISLRE